MMHALQKRPRSRLFTMVGLAAVTSAALAQEPAASVDALKQRIDQQQREIDALKAWIQSATPASAAAAKAPASTVVAGPVADARPGDRLTLSDTPEGYRVIDTG